MPIRDRHLLPAPTPAQMPLCIFLGGPEHGMLLPSPKLHAKIDDSLDPHFLVR